MTGCALVADVGGTHTRLALAHAGAGVPQLEQIQVFDTPRGRLNELLAAYLAETRTASIGACAVAAAGRVHRRPGHATVTLTNAQLTIAQGDLIGVGGSTRGLLLNDLAAAAAALPLLGPEDRIAIGASAAGAPGVRLVIGVGTGFGAAALTGEGSLLESESGHADLAAVTAEERQWLDRLSPQGRPSIESVVSGPGLSRLYDAMSTQGAIAPGEVIARARAGEPAAQRTLVAFCEWLGRVAGNLVLTYGAWAGVHLVGGVLEGMGAGFDAAAFRHGFEDKAPFCADLAAVPVHRVRHPQPALLGLASLALAADSGEAPPLR